VGLRMRKMASSGGVTPSDRAFLEMTLQDVTAREGIATKNAHIRTVSSVWRC